MQLLFEVKNQIGFVDVNAGSFVILYNKSRNM